MAAAILALDDMAEGVILPWQFGASYAIGLCITHGQFLESAFTWMNGRLSGDGVAGVALSAIVACLVEGGMAGIPTLTGAAVNVAIGLLDIYWPLRQAPTQTRRGKVISFLRGVGPR